MRILAFLVALLAIETASHAQDAPRPLMPNRLYLASSIAESGPEPERDLCEQLMRVYVKVAGDRAGDYKVLLLTSTDVNAMATVTKKGERLVIFTGRLLRGLRDDDAALAAVVGHEIGHHEAGHTTKGNDARRTMGTITTIAGAIVEYSLSKRSGVAAGLGREATGAAGQLVISKYSRDQEREADRIGLRMSAQAGYDPEGAVRLQEKFLKAFGNNASLMASHPPTKERLENLRQQIATDPLVRSSRPSAP